MHKFIFVFFLCAFNVHAELISVDWKTDGDNLITRDSVSGLDWLDLTETNYMSYGQVSAQLDTSGQFDGYRYATNLEVVSLWANFGINLDTVAPTYISSYVDPGIESVAVLLGNIADEDSGPYRTYPFGVLGLTANEAYTGHHSRFGAYNNSSSSFYVHGGSDTQSDEIAYGHTGSYLVTQSPVPIPAAVWLFGSGLIGLIGLARRKADV